MERRQESWFKGILFTISEVFVYRVLGTNPIHRISGWLGLPAIYNLNTLMEIIIE